MITILQKLFWGIAVPGYASLLIVLLFFNGLLLISNGIQGEYIARIFEEVKGRPLFVVGQTFGFDAVPIAATAPQPTQQHLAPPAPPALPSMKRVPPTMGGPMTSAPTVPVAPVAPAEPTASEAKSRHELPKPTRIGS
jgi:hypothetical protein